MSTVFHAVLGYSVPKMKSASKKFTSRLQTNTDSGRRSASPALRLSGTGGVVEKITGDFRGFRKSVDSRRGYRQNFGRSSGVLH